MINVLYESFEWSNISLCEYLNDSGCKASLADATDKGQMEQMDPGDVIINRVFPSADMRGHEKSLVYTEELLFSPPFYKTLVINPRDAFIYDCSKLMAYERLVHKTDVRIPAYCKFNSENRKNLKHTSSEKKYVLKRDCGGRSFDFRFYNSLSDVLGDDTIPLGFDFILQEFIEPVKGYTIRVEIVGDDVMAILKRFLGEGRVSSYSRGSGYETYKNPDPHIIEDSFKILKALSIEMGSLDFIEEEQGTHHLIDVNATSNFTPDYTDYLSLNPIRKMSDYILSRL